jgi:hypothetical protein
VHAVQPSTRPPKRGQSDTRPEVRLVVATHCPVGRQGPLG